MRLSKFLTIAGILTFISCLYVWQQTEILRLAYIGGNKIVVFEDLLDKNSILRYNMNRDTSLVHIVNKVSKIADLNMPKTYQVVRLAVPPVSGNRQALSKPKKESLFARLFGIKRQAEARTLNP